MFANLILNVKLREISLSQTIFLILEKVSNVGLLHIFTFLSKYFFMLNA